MVRVLLFFSMIFFLVGCYDRFYGPKIRNGFDHAITINIEYESGETHQSTWSPCETAFIGKKDNFVNRVVIFNNSSVLHDLKQADLAELLKNEKDKKGYFVWRVDQEGIVADTQQTCQNSDSY